VRHLILTAAALAALAAPALAESTAQRDAPTTRFYDSRGNLTGTATTYGNQTKFYAPNGPHTGTATHSSGR
jgi:opacity protein-like surface antigen